MQAMPSVSPAPMHPFPAISPLGLMAGGPLISNAPMMRPSAAPPHMLPAAANPAFMQQHQMAAMMAMRPPFGGLPGQAPGDTFFNFKFYKNWRKFYFKVLWAISSISGGRGEGKGKIGKYIVTVTHVSRAGLIQINKYIFTATQYRLQLSLETYMKYLFGQHNASMNKHLNKIC